MDNIQNSKKQGRIDLLHLHSELGTVDLLPGTQPEGLEFEALLTDPLFEVSCYQLGSAPGAGLFFDVVYEGRNFTLHQTVISKLYRIENFVVKRNYYCSVTGNVKASRPETLGPDTFTLQPPQDHGGSPDMFGRFPATGHAEAVGEAHRPAQKWADMDEGEEVGRHDSNQNLLSPSVIGRKTVSNEKIRFLEEKFLDELPMMGQHLVPYREFSFKNKAFTRRSFYLFDFVALFITPKHLLEDNGNFNFPYLAKKLELLDEISGTAMKYMPLQADTSGWNPLVRFLCLSLNGEFQVSFLRVALFLSIRKVANKEKILKAKIDDRTKSFFLGDESIRSDNCRIVRLNLSALTNNAQLQIDLQYAKNCVTPILEE